MPHPFRPSVRLLTRRRLDRRQEPHHRRDRGARCNPLRRGVDRARRRAVALTCCAVVAAAVAAAATARTAPAELLPAGLLPSHLLPAGLFPAGTGSGSGRAVDRLLPGLLVFGTLAAGAVAALRRRLRALDRRAAAAWERSWRRVEPLWSGRAIPWSDR